MRPLPILAALACLIPAATAGEPSKPPSAEVVVTVDGQRRIVPYPIEERFRNPWPAAWEREYWERVNHGLKAYEGLNGKYGNTFFENEKQSYPHAFIDYVNGNTKPAVKFLQDKDNNEWSDQTEGVDWYAAFTIRSQTRKYFWLGGALDPAYRQRMYDGAKAWTEVDPLRRPNKYWVPPGEREARKAPKEGWTPQTMNSWVDVRNTDNLRAMRDGAVYLMAEETGSETVRKAYHRNLAAYATACFSTGMGEWDSPNYLAHTLVGTLQTYDFARDPAVKSVAKGILDYLSAVAAMSYFKGSICGPGARDYMNVGPHEGFAAEFGLWFGDAPPEEGRPYRDFIHLASSGYRPPEAVIALARKDFPKPVEILSSKPSYEGWFKNPGGETQPAYFVTQYIADTYQIGTMPVMHVGDVNGFRIGVTEAKRGAATIIPFTGTAGYKGFSTATNNADRIAHERNAVIWINRQPAGKEADQCLFVPKSGAIETKDGWTFIRCEQSWLAIRALGAASTGVDEEYNTQLLTSTKDGKTKVNFPDDQVWRAKRGPGPTGIYLEIGEQRSHGSYEAFRDAVLAKARIDDAGLSGGKVSATTSTGRRLAIDASGDGLPTIERGGKVHDWKDHWALYAGGSEGESPITLGWKQGALSVKAGGKSFTGTMRDGAYTWENR